MAKKGNPLARVKEMKVFKLRIVKSKKGKGAYSRKGKPLSHVWCFPVLTFS